MPKKSRTYRDFFGIYYSNGYNKSIMMPQNQMYYGAPVQPGYPSPAPSMEPPKKSSKKVWIIVGVIVALVATAAIVPIVAILSINASRNVAEKTEDKPKESENKPEPEPETKTNSKINLTKEEAMKKQAEMLAYNGKDDGLMLYAPSDYLDPMAVSMFSSKSDDYSDKSEAKVALRAEMDEEAARCGTYKVAEGDYYVVARWDNRYADHGTYVCFDTIMFDEAYKKGNIDALKEYMKYYAIRSNRSAVNVYAYEFEETESELSLIRYHIGAGLKMGALGLFDFTLRDDGYDATKYPDTQFYLFLYNRKMTCNKATISCYWRVVEDEYGDNKDEVITEWEITNEEANKMINYK